MNQSTFSDQVASRHRLHKAIAELQTPERVAAFLEEILTPAEAKDLELRWALLEKLLLGQTQRSIASEMGLSLCKITRGARILKTPGGVVKTMLNASGRTLSLQDRAGRAPGQFPVVP